MSFGGKEFGIHEGDPVDLANKQGAVEVREVEQVGEAAIV